MGRDIKDSLAHPTALWRTSASGAVVFSESLFGSKPTSSTSDLIDGFNLTCSPGTFETEVEEITRPHLLVTQKKRSPARCLRPWATLLTVLDHLHCLSRRWWWHTSQWTRSLIISTPPRCRNCLRG